MRLSYGAEIADCLAVVGDVSPRNDLAFGGDQ